MHTVTLTHVNDDGTITLEDVQVPDEGEQAPPPPAIERYFETTEDFKEAGMPPNSAIGTPPPGVEYTKPDTTKLVVGVENPETRQEVEFTPELKALRDSTDPTERRLFNTLKREGFPNYERAVNAENFVSKQEENRFIRMNEKLPDGNWVSKEELEHIKQDDKDVYETLTTKGVEAANTLIEQKNKDVERYNATLRNVQKTIELQNSRLEDSGDKVGLDVAGRDFNEIRDVVLGHTPKNEQERQKATILAGIAASEYYPEFAYANAPFLFTTTQWGKLNTKDKAVNIGLDAAYILSLHGLRVPKIDLFTKVGKQAIEAGDAANQLAIYTRQVAEGAVRDTPAIRSTLQAMEQASREADIKLINTLGRTRDLTPSRVASIEKLSGLKGLAKSVSNIEDATDNLAKVRSELETKPYHVNANTAQEIAENEEYLRKQSELLKAHAMLAKARDEATLILQPRVKPSALQGEQWLSKMEDDIAKLRKEYSSVSAQVARSGSAEAKEELAAIERSLRAAEDDYSNAQQIIRSGGRPPMTSEGLRYKVQIKQTTDIKDIQRQLNEWLNEKGKYEPKPSGSGNKTTATIERLELELKLKPKMELKPEYRQQVRLAETPKIVPTKAAKPTPFSLPKKQKVEEQQKKRERVGAMTPEQERRLYGDEELGVVTSVRSRTIEEALSRNKKFTRLSDAEWQQVGELINAGLQADVSNLSDSQAKERIRNAVEQKTREQTKLNTEVKPLAQAKINTVTKLMTGRYFKIPEPLKTTLLKPKKVLLSQRASDKEKRDYIKSSGGAVAWRYGELHGKDRYDVIVNPYQSNEDYVMVLGKPPVGAVIIKGKGSARRTAKLIRGLETPRETIGIDNGAQDIKVIPTKKGISLDFDPDPKGLTDYPITIGGDRTRITQNRDVLSERRYKLSPSRPKITQSRPKIGR